MKRIAYLWWVCAIVIIALGFWAKVQAQTFGTPQQTILAFKYTNITGQATTTIKSGSGVLHTICVNTAAATETITIYDNTAGSGTKIGTATVYGSDNHCLKYDIHFAIGLTIVIARE